MRVLAKSSYCDIRKIIRGRAPHLPNFYFVHGGVIIKDEYADIAWVRGHLVLNVNFCGEVRGGSDKGAAEGGDKERPVLEDTSDEDVFDDTEIGLVSDTESAADSDSTWDLEREKKQYRKKVDQRRRKGGARTEHEKVVQERRNLRKRKGAQRTEQDKVVQERRDRRKRKGVERTENEKVVQERRNVRKRKGLQRT